jgi:hypothetical protein
MDAGVANERGIVTMNNFPENVGARVTALHFRQHIGPKSTGYGVGRIEPPSRNSTIQPVAHHLDHIIGYFGIVVVEG